MFKITPTKYLFFVLSFMYLNSFSQTNWLSIELNTSSYSNDNSSKIYGSSLLSGYFNFNDTTSIDINDLISYKVEIVNMADTVKYTKVFMRVVLEKDGLIIKSRINSIELLANKKYTSLLIDDLQDKFDLFNPENLSSEDQRWNSSMRIPDGIYKIKFQLFNKAEDVDKNVYITESLYGSIYIQWPEIRKITMDGSISYSPTKVNKLLQLNGISPKQLIASSDSSVNIEKVKNVYFGNSNTKGLNSYQFNEDKPCSEKRNPNYRYDNNYYNRGGNSSIIHNSKPGDIVYFYGYEILITSIERNRYAYGLLFDPRKQKRIAVSISDFQVYKDINYPQIGCLNGVSEVIYDDEDGVFDNGRHKKNLQLFRLISEEESYVNSMENLNSDYQTLWKIPCEEMSDEDFAKLEKVTNALINGNKLRLKYAEQVYGRPSYLSEINKYYENTSASIKKIGELLAIRKLERIQRK